MPTLQQRSRGISYLFLNHDSEFRKNYFLEEPRLHQLLHVLLQQSLALPGAVTVAQGQESRMQGGKRCLSQTRREPVRTLRAAVWS